MARQSVEPTTDERSTNMERGRTGSRWLAFLLSVAFAIGFGFGVGIAHTPGRSLSALGEKRLEAQVGAIRAMVQIVAIDWGQTPYRQSNEDRGGSIYSSCLDAVDVYAHDTQRLTVKTLDDAGLPLPSDLDCSPPGY